MDVRGLIKATAAAFTAQGVNAAVSALTVLILAGSLGASEYGHWQLYTLAASFSGLFQLGLCDGVYLRLGGKSYDELDFSQLGRQFRRMCVSQFLVALLGILALLLLSQAGLLGVAIESGRSLLGGLWSESLASSEAGGRLWAVCGAFFYMPLFNAAAYLGYILQASGRTAAYSLSSIIDRAVFALFVLVATLSGAGDFRLFILFAIVSKLVSLIYCISANREVVFAPGVDAPGQSLADILAGGRLMLANLSGLLIAGGARLAVISRWGSSEFGRISFVITLSGIFVQFAAQLAMVIFPSLRREEGAALSQIIARMRSAAGLVLPAIYLLYIPVKFSVSLLLPQYAGKLTYLACLLPLCLFEARCQLIGQTCLKVRRHESRLLAVNLVSAGVSLVLCFGAAYVFEDIGLVLGGAVCGAALRCLFTELAATEGKERTEAFMSLLCDLALSGVFVSASLMLPDATAVAVYLIFYAGYIFIRRGELTGIALRRI